MINGITTVQPSIHERMARLQEQLRRPLIQSFPLDRPSSVALSASSTLLRLSEFLFASHTLPHDNSSEQEPGSALKDGTAFIKDHILSGVTQETFALFEELNPSTYIFILTKAIYVFIENNNDPIPDFFKPETKECIEDQREKFKNNPEKEHITKELQEIMKDVGEFENTDKQDQAVKDLLTCLKGIAHREIHTSLLVKNVCKTL